MFGFEDWLNVFGFLFAGGPRLVVACMVFVVVIVVAVLVGFVGGVGFDGGVDYCE